MKKYEVEVRFYAKLTERELYTRYYTIMEESDKRAWAVVHNYLILMDFHNFIIKNIRELES